MRSKFNSILILLITLIWSCKKPYNPPVVTAPNSYLVVEGVIDPGSDSTIINLSSTTNIGVKGVSPVLKAALVVEGSQQSNTYPLIEIGNGKYAYPGLNLTGSKQYRLRIVLQSGKTYISDFEDAKITPPIDSLNYIIQSGGLQINSAAHDATNNTRYYRWLYNETWEFHPSLSSSSIYDGVYVRPRFKNELIYTCWGNDTSSNVLLNSSAKLVQDVISGNAITFIPSTSEKIAVRYSILLKQYALTSNAYNFWQNLRKNTEQLGSIFDAQPSQLVGNIHCLTVSTEPVIGYVSVSTVSTKRIFIENRKLPAWGTIPFYTNCKEDTVKFADVNARFRLYNGHLLLIPTRELKDKNGSGIGYLGSTPECADCTLRGSTKQPVFW